MANVGGGVYKSLQQQLDKLQRHVNQGSIKTRYRYREAADRFTEFLSERYKLQKFANVQEKHVLAYVEHMQSKGLSASTIKTDLSGIRYYHDQTGSKNVLPDNKMLEDKHGIRLEKRSFGGVPRAWTDSEVSSAMDLAVRHGRPDVARTLEFARTLGLRLHETIRLERSHLTQALRDDHLTIKGKGGLVREIPLHASGRQTIERALDNAPRSGKLFVDPGQKAHQVMKSVENWIYSHRESFAESEIRLTYHGLRHAYAKDRYEYHLNRTHNEKEARLAVSHELGHGRDSVTRIYLD